VPFILAGGCVLGPKRAPKCQPPSRAPQLWPSSHESTALYGFGRPCVPAWSPTASAHALYCCPGISSSLAPNCPQGAGLEGLAPAHWPWFRHWPARDLAPVSNERACELFVPRESPSAILPGSIVSICALLCLRGYVDLPESVLSRFFCEMKMC